MTPQGLIIWTASRDNPNGTALFNPRAFLSDAQGVGDPFSMITLLSHNMMKYSRSMASVRLFHCWYAPTDDTQAISFSSANGWLKANGVTLYSFDPTQFMGFIRFAPGNIYFNAGTCYLEGYEHPLADLTLPLNYLNAGSISGPITLSREFNPSLTGVKNSSTSRMWIVLGLLSAS